MTFDAEPADGDLAHLGDVSTAMALYERDGETLRPVELPRRDRFDDDLLTILKCPGKTNQVFTKLTHVAARDDALAVLTDSRLEVLDDGAYRGFPHRVDQAIQRDVLIATKPR